MSWDVSVFAFKEPPTPIDQMPKDWRPPVMGTGDEVRSLISTYLFGVDWSDPTWGLYEGDGFSFEFSMGSDELIDNFAVHVRGSGDAVADLMKFAVPNGWYVLDWSSGDWLDPGKPCEESWKKFQAYRDRIVREYRDEP